MGGGAGAPPLANYLPPCLSFSSDFGRLILKIPIQNEKVNILSAFFVKVVGALTPALKVGVAAVPSALPPCSYACGQDFVQEGNRSGGPHAFFPIPQEEGKMPTVPLPKTEKPTETKISEKSVYKVLRK